MQIAWIGTGVMGSAMADHLLTAGHELTLYSRTQSKAAKLLQCGAHWAASPRAAAAAADSVGIMVGFPEDVETVVLGTEGALQAMHPGTLLVDFTTSRPSLAIRIANAAAERGVLALDAPVSGGDIGAREARLSIMVGGTKDAFEKALPMLNCLGKTVVHQGPAGSGQHAKMVNQIMIAANMMGVCEGLLYARQAGLDPAKVLASIGGGAAASWSLTNLYPRILAGNYQPGFYVEHFIKDLQIALEEATRLNLKLPGLALAHQLYEAVRAGGGARLGTQALILALARLNNIAS
ncbi:MAG: NAD(P)-dependent oxidoreductase [Kiritimatiellaeota bacterium]|nr:NAD(P)-dependent oxidoreductase [Kiritimatiellota bacterium]